MTKGKATAAKKAKQKAQSKSGQQKNALEKRVSSGTTSGVIAREPEPRYQKTQREYAEMYGKSLSTIKRWWKEGKPLDDPDQMGEFLSPRGRKPEAEVDPVWEAAVPMEVIPQEFAAEVPVALDETFFEGQGVLAAILRLQKAERERAAAYFDAILRNAPPQVLKNRFGEWTGIIEALRKLEKDAPDIRRANDLSIDRKEMEAALGHIFAAFRAAARNLPHRASAKLLAARTREEFVQVLEIEVEVLLRTLTDISTTAASGDTEFKDSADGDHAAPTELKRKPKSPRKRKGGSK